MSEFLMPSLGADMDAGTLVEQLLAPGAPVHRGDVIGAVETQKGVIEVEAFQNGVLTEWLVDIGSKVPVGTPMAMIATDAATPPKPEQPQPELPDDAPPEMPQTPEPTPQPPQPENLPIEEPSPVPPGPEIPPTDPQQGKARLRITPAARRLAARRHVDLSALRTVPHQTITRADILGLDPVTKPPPATDMRAAIAAAMSRSKREIPHYYLSHMIDLTAADRFLAATNKDRKLQERLLPAAIVACAIARAVEKYPEFNGHYTDGAFAPSAAVSLGLAIHIRGGGLVAPALLDARGRSPETMMTQIRDLVARVRAGRFRARELSDATITLSSLGDRGVDEVYGVIYPPQVAIIGLGTPRLHPMIRDGKVVPRMAARMTLAADHRASDGHSGALFLRAIDKHLQEPETL